MKIAATAATTTTQSAAIVIGRPPRRNHRRALTLASNVHNLRNHDAARTTAPYARNQIGTHGILHARLGPALQPVYRRAPDDHEPRWPRDDRFARAGCTSRIRLEPGRRGRPHARR